jgi:serine/threonine-protein kinase
MPFDVVLHNRYRLVKRIGQRSISVVYLADDQTLHAKCAIKIILPELIGDDQSSSDRLLVAATATSVITHPNLVKISDSGKLACRVPFLCMEFVSGTNLQDELAASGPIEPTHALEYMLPICSGLAVVHRRDITHGDLKPRSILISSDPRLVKISDFGMSLLKSGKLYGPQAEAKAKGSGMLRSPLYLAPEEWSEEKTDSRSDIYSLGVMLYQMLTGNVPFKGKSAAAIMKQHLMDLPPPITKLPGISPELEEVVMHALAKDPNDRPPTVEEFIAELQFVVNDAGVATIVQPRHSLLRSTANGEIAPVPEFADGPTPVGHNSGSQQIVDLDSTVVLTRKDLEAARAAINLAPATPDNFDLTIVPGMLGSTSTQPVSDESIPVESVVAYPSTEPVKESPLDEHQSDPSFAESDVDDSPPPKTIAPLLLAVAVVLIVVLIGVGVYYSRSLE